MNFIKNGIGHKLPASQGQRPVEGQSPKELWEGKLKAFKIKFFLFFILSHLLWVMGTLENGHEEFSPKEAPISKGHTIVQLPAWNYGESPRKGKKIEVSLFGPDRNQIINGHLRGLMEDPLGETGSKAIVEVLHRDLLTIKNAKGPWSIYPSLKNSFSQKLSKDPYEISW